jgi:hypothetical protein
MVFTTAVFNPGKCIGLPLLTDMKACFQLQSPVSRKPISESRRGHDKTVFESTRAWMRVFIVLILLTITNGCRRSSSYETRLAENERIAEKTAVLLDQSVVGYVNSIKMKGEDRIAVLRLTNEVATRTVLRQGTVRVLVDDGQIHLRTDEVKPESPALPEGAIIPVMSKTGFAIHRFSSNRTLTAILVGLAGIAVMVLLFRRLVRGWLLLLTLVLSATSAWILLPWTAGAVARGYALVPKTPSIANGAPATAGTSQTLSTFFESPPNPQAVAYAAVFIVAFIVLSVVLRGAFNRLENRG